MEPFEHYYLLSRDLQLHLGFPKLFLVLVLFGLKWRNELQKLFNFGNKRQAFNFVHLQYALHHFYQFVDRRLLKTSFIRWILLLEEVT